MVRMSPEQLRLIQERGRPNDPAARRRAAGRQARAAGAAWESAIIEWCNLGGWVWWQATAVPIRYPGQPADAPAPFMTPGRGTRGAFDFEAFHPTRRLYVRAEAKAGAARLSPQQVLWRDGMRAAGVLAVVWRDKHRDDVRDWLLGPRLSGRVVDPVPGLHTT